ncbi:uncharacterized protein LOC103711240 [Phoenix dactylifera]|uniref:Uncharacterized protein LOC103711240 n=1 Tax=Phoenix dactylifera TaxID=42345 RepID=A0A8B7CB51_PHODC|nr:uncharacterized protein LOC103711240 [Phoenix dactylifera]
MAITHDDLSLRAHRSTDVRSKLAPSLAALSVACGLFSFVLCLAAEGSRTEATWYIMSNQGNGSKTYQCVYDGSGRRPLVLAVSAFLLLAVAMFAEHAYMLVAVTSPKPPGSLVAWTPEDPSLASSARNLAWQTCFIFLATWICFTIAEVLLMIGMAVESSHISQWTKPRPDCHVIRPGLFAAAGILGLITVFLGIALYLTAFRTQTLHQVAEGMQRGAPNTAHQHRVPPSAPGEPGATAAHQSQAPQENPSLNKTSTSA